MTPRLSTRNQTSFRVTWPRPPVPVDGYQVALIPLVSWGQGQGWGQVPSATVAPVSWPQCGPNITFIPRMRWHLWPPAAAPLGDTTRMSLWCPKHVPSGQTTSCCLSQGWGHLHSTSRVPRMSCGGVAHLLPGLGMGPPMVSPPWCPQCVLCPQDEPAAVATLLLPGLGTGMCPQNDVPSIPNMSPVPRMSHLPAALLRDRDMSPLWYPQHVPNMSPSPSHWLQPPTLLRDEEVSSPHCPQCVPIVSPTCPPAPGEALGCGQLPAA